MRKPILVFVLCVLYSQCVFQGAFAQTDPTQTDAEKHNVHSQVTFHDLVESVQAYDAKHGAASVKSLYSDIIKYPKPLDLDSTLMTTIQRPEVMVELRSEAAHGNPYAQFSLAELYANGLSVPKDYVKADFWYRKAAEQGLATAQNELGGSYLFGWGVTRNTTIGHYWTRRAAEQGLAAAQYNLGNYYFSALSVPRHYTQADLWWRKAAKQGYAKAQYNLGHSYFLGQGVPQNTLQAIFWWKKAAAQGSKSALKAIQISEHTIGSATASATRTAWGGNHWQYIGYTYSGFKTYLDISIPVIKRQGKSEVLLARTHGKYLPGMKMLLFVDCENADNAILFGPVIKSAETGSVINLANKRINEIQALPLSTIEERLLDYGQLSPIQSGTLQALVYQNQCQ